MSTPAKNTPLRDLAAPFSGVLLDAYGVFWAGNAAGLLPGAREAMKHLVESGKIVGILSNSTRLATKEIEKLQRHGLFEGSHFHFLITSGEITRKIVLSGSLPFIPTSNRYYVLGGPYPIAGLHHEIFYEGPYTETENIGEAGFIYASTPQLQGLDQTDPTVFEEHVKACLDSNLPMLCSNPDFFAHEGNPPHPVVRQGSLARRYEELGGKVYYVGKPYTNAFEQAMQHFAKHKIDHPSDIVMIGDTPETDVRGAKNFGMSTALITHTGIMAERLQENGNQEILRSLPASDSPTFFLERLRL